MIHAREDLDPLTSARKLQEYKYKVIQFWIRKVLMTIEQEDKRDILKKWLDGDHESKENVKNAHLSSMSD